ncbi:hypothetical protein M8C21_011755 [Ambrosia artemisiifolia]|uniref:WAT1-related protein n=1 Tax=Ambrosia artemisiifolia TaxID=4212 RepID=A0AAD5CTH8_AMBAR|nr:hypothetical protein M8C21_011755 [Ambrosia artemisiifolia]
MKEYIGMVLVQTAQVLLLTVSKVAIADGMSNYSFVFYSNALASLVLLPLSLIFFHRSVNRPAISFIVVFGFFVVGILGFLSQIIGYIGISYSSATLATILFNLIPGFTFILAIICRMETIQFGSSSTQAAKFIGTVVSVAGAIMVTLYKGPPILSSPIKSEMLKNLIKQPSNWVLGGIFLAIDAVFASMSIIAQAFVLKKYPAEMILVNAYCVICTILSGLTSLVVEDDLSIVVIIGFYSVMWGKAKEQKIMAVSKTEDEHAPLLQDVEGQMTPSSS